MDNKTLPQDFWTIYDKCQSLAKAAASAESERLRERRRKSKKALKRKDVDRVCHEAQYWIELPEKYRKGELTEEQVKALILQ